MRQFLFATGLFLFTVNGAFGQVDIHVQNDPGVSYNGDTVFVVGTAESVYDNLYIVNSTGSSQGFKWKRVRLYMSNVSFTDQLCDNQYCFDCNGDPWVRPAALTIPDGDSTLFQPKLLTGGLSGSAHFRYYILNSSDVVLDSVDVYYTTTVGTEEMTELEYKLYPNPTNGLVNLVLPETSGEVKIVLFNMVGAEVLKQTLVQGSNVINCESLENGVYFYSIIRNNEVVETKKLIIRH